MYARAEEQRRKSERNMILLGSGRPTRRSIGKMAGEPHSGAVAPTAGQELGLDKAGALSKIKVMDPGPPEGPQREAVGTNGAQRWASSRGNVTGSRFRWGSVLVM